MNPQDEVAHDFMVRKGYRSIAPYDVQKLDGQPCWYFLYDLPEGVLELEVFYDEDKQDWETMVTTFKLLSRTASS